MMLVTNLQIKHNLDKFQQYKENLAHSITNQPKDDNILKKINA